MQSETERLNEEFKGRMEENQKKADEKTNKKRAKRLKVSDLNFVEISHCIIYSLVEKAKGQSECKESEEE